MGLLDNPTPTKSDWTSRSVEEIQARIQQSLEDNISTMNFCFERVWANPYGGATPATADKPYAAGVDTPSPQDIFSEFGANAAQLFQFAGLMQNLLNTVKAGSWTQAPPLPFTINADGTVTVNTGV